MKRNVRILSMVIFAVVLISLLTVSVFAAEDHKHNYDSGYFYSGDCVQGFTVAFECLDCDYVLYLNHSLSQHDMNDGVCDRCGYSEKESEILESTQTFPVDTEPVDPKETAVTVEPIDFEKPSAINQSGLLCFAFVLTAVLLSIGVVFVIIKKKGMKNNEKKK